MQFLFRQTIAVALAVFVAGVGQWSWWQLQETGKSGSEPLRAAVTAPVPSCTVPPPCPAGFVGFPTPMAPTTCYGTPSVSCLPPGACGAGMCTAGGTCSAVFCASTETCIAGGCYTLGCDNDSICNAPFETCSSCIGDCPCAGTCTAGVCSSPPPPPPPPPGVYCCSDGCSMGHGSCPPGETAYNTQAQCMTGCRYCCDPTVPLCSWLPPSNCTTSPAFNTLSQCNVFCPPTPLSCDYDGFCNGLIGERCACSDCYGNPSICPNVGEQCVAGACVVPSSSSSSSSSSSTSTCEFGAPDGMCDSIMEGCSCSDCDGYVTATCYENGRRCGIGITAGTCICPGISPSEGPPFYCADIVDNDCDGAIDCSDSGCTLASNCQHETNCDDHIDNDTDGMIDCADFNVLDCPGGTSCRTPNTSPILSPSQSNLPGTCTFSTTHLCCTANEIGYCSNGKDDDCDGSTDVFDTDCSSPPSFTAPTTTGGATWPTGATTTAPSVTASPSTFFRSLSTFIFGAGTPSGIMRIFYPPTAPAPLLNTVPPMPTRAMPLP